MICSKHISSFIKHLAVICLFSLVSLIIFGYRFGDGDQNSHISFLQKMLSPDLYPNNSFIDLRFYHYSYFWHLLVPILKLGFISLEKLAFAIYCLILIATFAAYYDLIRVFVKNKDISYWALLSFIVPAYSFTIFPTHETYLVNRFFALPLLLWAIRFWFKEKYIFAMLFVGIALNFHGISATFVLFMFFVSWINLRNKIPAQRILSGVLVFILSALPVLLWKISLPVDIGLPANHRWYDLISRGALGHVFHLFSTNPPVIVLTLLGISNYLVMVIVVKHVSHYYNSSVVSAVKSFMIAIFIILLVAIFVGEIYPSPAILQFQPARIGMFIPVIGFPLFAGFIDRLCHLSKISKKQGKSILLLLAMSTLLVIPYLGLLVVKSKKKRLLPFFVILTLFGWIYTIPTVIKLDLWQPGINIQAPHSPWQEVMQWSKNNTAIDDLFITPVDKWSHYSSDFTLGAQRNTVVTLGELMELAFFPGRISDWEKKFNDIVPGGVQSLTGNFQTNKKIVRNLYESNSGDDFVKLSKKYHAKYVIVEITHTALPGVVVYKNSEYIIYDLSEHLQPE